MNTDEPPLILVGHPDGDALITEKFLTIYRLKGARERERPGLKVRVLSVNAFRTLHRAGEGEAVIVLSPHSQSALSLHLQDNQVYLLGRQRSDVVLANWIFPVTSDKFSTYEAIERARDVLIPHGMYPLRFWRAWDREESKV